MQQQPNTNNQKTTIEESLYSKYSDFRNQHWESYDLEMQTVITGHLFIESAIDSIISTVFRDASPFRRYSYSQKIGLLQSIGDITPITIGRLESIGKLRNKYAHNLEYRIKYEDIKKLNVPDISKEKWDKDKLKTMQACLSYCAGMIHAWLVFYQNKKKENISIL